VIELLGLDSLRGKFLRTSQRICLPTQQWIGTRRRTTFRQYFRGIPRWSKLKVRKTFRFSFGVGQLRSGGFDRDL